MEQNAMEVVNENVLDEQADVEMEHQYEKKIECKAEKQESLVSLNELTKKYCDIKDEQPEINEHNSDENNEYVSRTDVIQSQQLKGGPYHENSSEIEIIPPLNDVFSHKLEAEHDFEFGFKQTEDFNLSCDETNIISNSFSDSLYTDNFSCSLSFSLSNPSSSSSHFSRLPRTLNEHSEYSFTNEEDLLFSYLKEMSNDNLEPKEDVENFETLSLVKSNFINDTLEYDLLQYVLENVKFEDDNEVDRNSECFVGDRIIINPDIMYNIELRLHLKTMQLLAEQISKTPDDLTLLNRCMELILIPEMKKERHKITDESTPFCEDISESNLYNIQHKNWNKIIVNQPAVLSHVRFDYTSKDTLYLLKNESIEYIRRLVGIMKKNFDIQPESSSLSSIDSIQNSLQEIGVEGGVMELIKHYENDVFLRRKRLLKECEHFESIINQFVKRMLLTPSVKNKYYNTQEFLVEKQSTNKINGIAENVFREEKASTAVESGHIGNINTVPVKSEIIDTSTDDIYNRKMYYTKFTNSDIQSNDLLKCSHMLCVPPKPKSNLFTSRKSFLSTENSSNRQNEKNNYLLRNKKVFDVSKSDSTSTFNKNIPNFVKSIGLDQESFQKIIDEFKKTCNHESSKNPDIDNTIEVNNYSDNPSCEPI